MYDPDAEVTIKLRELKEILDKHTVEDGLDYSIPGESVDDIMEQVYHRNLIDECCKRG
jgi:hypothetical protein